MARPNRYARAVHIVFALALVFGLAAAALVPTLDTPPVGASPGTPLVAPSEWHLETFGNGTAEWSTEQHHERDYSAKLGWPQLNVNDQGRVSYAYTGDLDSITSLSYWYYVHADTAQEPSMNTGFIKTNACKQADGCGQSAAYGGPYLQLRIDADGDGVVDTAAIECQFAVTSTGSWVKNTVVFDDTPFYVPTNLGCTSPLPWSPDPWGTFEDAQAGSLTSCGDGDIDLGTADVLWVNVKVGSWSGVGGPDAPVTVYIDDLEINGTTYDMEPLTELLPSIAYNVKGAQETFTLYDNDLYANHCPENPEAGDACCYRFDWDVLSGVCGPSVVIKAGGGTGDEYITIQSSEPGDAHVTLTVEHWTGTEWEDAATFNAEKKWGELTESVLDVDSSTTCVDHEKWISRTGDEEISETIKDTVTANFYWGECTSETLEAHVADDAWVHWWLLEDTTANQEAITDIMDMLETGHGTWCGCGPFGPDDDDPFDTIWALALTQHTTDTEWNAASRHDPPASRPVDAGYDPATDGYYYTFTESDTAGETTATLVNDAVEDVLIVVYVEYPINYNGQNPVCVEMGKKHFGVPPPVVQVKVPQTRWAGEKIVLEKDWSTAYYGKVVTFQLEHPGVGTLEVASGVDGFGYGELVYTAVDESGIARCILNSEEPGQADVKAVLYDETWAAVFATPTPAGYPTSPISEHAFVVFFLKLEEVTPLDTSPDPLALDADAEFGVQVKGWFTSSNLSLRLALDVDLDGDGTDDAQLPAGRWVMPDDWPILAGADPLELRPHWDLMNDWANNDDITSTNKLGPFDGEVQTVPTPDGPGEAEYPTIGPFSTLQEFSDLDMWISEAVVPADSTISGGLRNTVVPDGEIDLYDCPMPTAKVIFRLTGDTIFIEKMKTAVSDYLVSTAYKGPYYEVEIPANSLIPPLTVSPEGYSWDSWGFDATADGPYEFWDDLAESSSTKVLEVYTDNNGRAYVTVDGLSSAGTVDVTATADYPYLRKHPAMKCEAVTLTWQVATGGPVGDTIDLLSGVNLVQWWLPYGDQELPEALTNIGPEGLDVVSVLWHRDTISGAWLWFDPELPGASPLQILDAVAVPDTKVYVVVVTTGCTWESP